MAMRWVLGAAVMAVVGMVACSDTAVYCGELTEEVDGTCVSTVPPAPAPCGFGTVFDAVLEQCVAELPPASCGELTSCELNADGYRECACSDVAVECP